MNPFAKIGERSYRGGRKPLAFEYRFTRRYVVEKVWTCWGRFWTFKELARLAKMPQETFVERLRRGWRPEAAVTVPVARPRRAKKNDEPDPGRAELV